MPCLRAWPCAAWVGACVAGLLLLPLSGCPGEGSPSGDVPDAAANDDGGAMPSPDAGGSRPVVTPGAADRVLLRGTLLLPGGPMYGELLIEGTHIRCVAASCSEQPAAQGATVVQTAGIIAPGLIDAHNHGLFNLFDEGDWNPGRFYSNHNSWTTDTRYKQVVDAKQYLNSEGTSPVDLRCEIDKYAELKGLVAGTTSFLLAPGAVTLACYQSLARTIDTAQNDLGQDLLRTSISVPNESTAMSTCASFTAGTTSAYVVHVGEGIDQTARNEFATLESRAGGCLLAPQTAIVHGTAFGAPEFMKMGATGMKLVWSPKSNLFLYNDTTRIDLAIAGGVQTIALAPDWSLGGSVNLLDELRVAYGLGQTRFAGLLPPRRLFEMVTIEPARVLGVDKLIGSLEVGKRADVILLSGDAGQPYEALIQARPSTIDLVMVDGRVLYGAPDLRATAPATPACDEIEVCGAARFVCVAEASTANKLNQTFGDVKGAIVSGLSAYDAMVATLGIAPFSPLAPLAKCQ